MSPFFVVMRQNMQNYWDYGLGRSGSYNPWFLKAVVLVYGS